MKRATQLLISVVALGCSSVATDSDEGAAKRASEIIGGYSAQPGQAPWQAAIFYAGSFECGGSLVAPDWVLTAGHCATPTSNTTVVLGDLDQMTSEGTEQSRSVDQIIVHPSFGYDAQSIPINDVALLHVTPPFKIKPGVVELIRPSAERAEDMPESLVTGWGWYGGSILRAAALPIQPASACASSTLPRPQLLPSEICAGRVDGFIATCHGDSGGPVVGRSDATSSWQQVGVVSWGEPQCRTYSVLDRVQYYLPFIRKYVVDVAALAAVSVALQ